MIIPDTPCTSYLEDPSMNHPVESWRFGLIQTFVTHHLMFYLLSYCSRTWAILGYTLPIT